MHNRNNKPKRDNKRENNDKLQHSEKPEKRRTIRTKIPKDKTGSDNMALQENKRTNKRNKTTNNPTRELRKQGKTKKIPNKGEPKKDKRRTPMRIHRASRPIPDSKPEKQETIKQKLKTPTEIQEIEIEYTRKEKDLFYKNGTLVRIQPIKKEYKGKTYLGILIGQIQVGTGVRVYEKEKRIKISPKYNTAIYVPELKEIILGVESWWSTIEKPEQLKQITTEEIQSSPIAQIIKGMMIHEEIHGRKRANTNPRKNNK